MIQFLLLHKNNYYKEKFSLNNYYKEKFSLNNYKHI